MDINPSKKKGLGKKINKKSELRSLFPVPFDRGQQTVDPMDTEKRMRVYKLGTPMHATSPGKTTHNLKCVFKSPPIINR